jgi:hypothetical protein
MKNDVGYIYILINPSLEGLIKVGKTTRDPIDHAVELSKATGVPTPFIVAYHIRHTLLSVILLKPLSVCIIILS